MKSFTDSLLICLISVSAAGQQPEPLPQFSLPRSDMRSQELKENIVVLDFWATWCTPCVSEIPAFNKLQEKYGSRGVKVIGVAAQSGWDSDVKKFVADLPFPIGSHMRSERAQK